jgi:adenylate cyclase
MKRFSIYFLFGISILTAAFVYDYFANIADWKSFYHRRFLVKVDLLDSEALVARSFLEARKDEGEVADFLESRRRQGSIDFWVHYRNGVVLDTSLRPQELKEAEFKLDVPGQDILELTPLDYYVVERLKTDLGNEVLVVGSHYDQEKFLADNLAERKEAIIRYCIGIFLICLTIFVFLFRDFMNSISILVRGGRRSYRGISLRSREAEMLVRGLISYDDKTIELKKEKEMFIWQVLPSLRTELMSGRKPPYDFGCTLVRTDINNFSTIYSDFPVEEFAATISDFFTDVSHVVSRYNGLIHEFIGDEVIFYLKDEDCGNSSIAAVSAIRDINQIAVEYNKMTTTERGYPFTVKSAFSHGRLRFGKFVNGYGIAGPALIESVRIISHIHEKDDNVVVFDSRHLGSIKNVVISEFYADAKLKGLPEDRQLYSYAGNRPIREFLNGNDELDLIRYYRSDEDLCVLLSWAMERSRHPSDVSHVLRLIGVLRQVPVTRSNGAPQKLLLSWIENLMQEVKTAGSDCDDAHLRILASIVRLTENLVPPGSFTHEYEAVIRDVLNVNDRRVVANALDALTLFRRDYEPTLAERLARHLDNRVAANALVHEGIREISPFVVKRLIKLLKSRKVAHVASGLYAFGEIAAFHRLQDPVYFNTQLAFQRLAHQLLVLVVHEDARVRRQAQIAVRKFRDTNLIIEVWGALRASKDSRVIEEAKENLGEAPPFDSEERKVA